jgi:phage protein D
MSMMDMLGSPQTSGRNTRGRTPIYRIMLAGEPLDVTVQDCSIMMGENMHDTVEMTVSSTERTTTAGLLEQPISFLFGLAPKTEVFCGYVIAVAEKQNESGTLTWTMSMTGPTKSMQTGNPRFWTQRTIPSAVETLTYVSYLGYAGHAHTHLWPALAQTDSSDWQMAVKLATRLGWSVFNRYGIVLLYDPLQLFRDQGSAATLISETYTLAKASMDEERVLLEFDPTEVAESSVEQQGYKVAYFNNDQMQVALQKGDHSNYSFLTDFVIRDASEASLYVNSKDSDSSRWAQTAKARIMGNAALYPGMTVEVMTTNAKYYTGKFNGRWLVRAVQHKMDRQSYQSNLALARPDGTTQVFTGGYVPFWQSLGKSKPVLTLSQTMNMLQPVNSIGILPSSIEKWPTIIDTPSASTNVWVSSWSNATVRTIAS